MPSNRKPTKNPSRDSTSSAGGTGNAGAGAGAGTELERDGGGGAEDIPADAAATARVGVPGDEGPLLATDELA